MTEEQKFAMRSPKITTISLEEYTVKYSPDIKQAVTQILYNPDHLQFSQEELLRAIYNVCCQRHSSLLHVDIMECIQNHLNQVLQHLSSMSGIHFLSAITHHIQRFRKSVAVLQQLCRYLERVYVVDKFGSPISTICLNAFNQCIVNDPIQKPRLCALLQSLPPNIDPNLCMSLTKELYSLDKSNAMLCTRLFVMHIPCLQTTHDLEKDIQETQNFIQQLTDQGYPHETIDRNAHKRKYSQ